ncbi:hypothetical protein BB559_005506 [Furculomyces boomerangus]|uniref:Uncharacterized protein n=1 Tax=Furculomyces boomerangus TaxID=61424 RepID=A0A2T9Y721_9FUNG|nr:hypothetical protein BB559_005706 [Furculomyces boomerangus]PVU88597.1 hypothetical protein BB559_005506 [Furculomyces boomerangus]
METSEYCCDISKNLSTVLKSCSALSDLDSIVKIVKGEHEFKSGKSNVYYSISFQEKSIQESAIIDNRIRMLCTFIKRLLLDKILRNEHVLHRFLSPDISWDEVLHSTAVASLPENPLFYSPSKSFPELYSSDNPGYPKSIDKNSLNNHSIVLVANNNYAKGSSLPSFVSKISNPDIFWERIDIQNNQAIKAWKEKIEKNTKSIYQKLRELNESYSELGAALNCLSLVEESTTSSSIEISGQAVDKMFTAQESIKDDFLKLAVEPTEEYSGLYTSCQRTLRYRNNKQIQLEATEYQLNKTRSALDNLIKIDADADRLTNALQITNGEETSDFQKKITRRSSSLLVNRDNDDFKDHSINSESLDYNGNITSNESEFINGRDVKTNTSSSPNSTKNPEDHEETEVEGDNSNLLSENFGTVNNIVSDEIYGNENHNFQNNTADLVQDHEDVEETNQNGIHTQESVINSEPVIQNDSYDYMNDSYGEEYTTYVQDPDDPLLQFHMDHSIFYEDESIPTAIPQLLPKPIKKRKRIDKPRNTNLQTKGGLVDIENKSRNGELQTKDVQNVDGFINGGDKNKNTKILNTSRALVNASSVFKLTSKFTNLPLALTTAVINQLSYSLYKIIDVDPNNQRRLSITKLSTRVGQLEETVQQLRNDLVLVNYSVNKSVVFFNGEKARDFEKMAKDFVDMHTKMGKLGIEIWKPVKLFIENE